MKIVRRYFSGIKMQLLLIILGAILPFFLLSIYNIQHMLRIESRNVEINAQEQAYIAAREFEVLIQNSRHLLYLATEDKQLVTDRDYCQVYVEAVPYREPTIKNLVILSASGELICSSFPIKLPEGLSETAWFDTIRFGQSFTIVPIDRYWKSVGIYTTIATAHFNDIGLTDGIVVALLDQSWIQTVRNRIQLPENSTISIIDKYGNFIYRDPFKEEYLDEKAGQGFVNAMANSARKGSFVETGLDNVERFYGFARLDPLYGGDYIHVGIPKNKALESVQTLLVQNVLINLLVMGLAVSFASSFASQRIIRIVDKLLEVSKKLASGDLTAQTGFSAKEGELGFLAQTFDSTINSLRIKDEERQAALEEVSRERQYFKMLVESSPDAIAILDSKEKVQVINPAFTGMFGYTAEEIENKNLDELINTHETLAQAKNLTHQVKEGETIHIISKRRSKTGKIIDVDISGVPIMVNGKQMGDFGIYHNITDLIEAKQNAEASAKAKADFLANMSHEIRTPLNAVIGMTNLLMDTRLDATQYDFVETIRTSGEDLLTIINDILDFSKIEAGKLDIEATPFDLGDCIESALQLLSPRASEKGLEMLYLIDQSVPAAIISDPTRLRQIIVNLLGNAIKFTERGEIFLSVDSKPLDNNEVEVHVSVADTGIGISEEARSRIFQSFSQADTSTTRKFGGTGLGLSISKRLAETMGGSMWYESEAGKGSTFHFTIKATATESIHKQIVSDGFAISKGKTVLIVDDNERNRLILEKQLESWQMNCIPASSGFQALEILRRINTIDAAIMDMQMPEMDGVMLAKSVREISGYKKLPLILLSSLGRQENIKEDRGLFSAQLSKPVRPSVLLEALLSLFANKPIIVRDNQQINSDVDPQMGTKHPLRILLADDNVVNQKVAIRMLERIGYRADLAGNGLEALQAVERQTYDLVFMDVQMPEMDGLEASRQIHSRIPKERLPRIIAMTAHALQGDRERFLAEGMDDYLSKPVQLTEMVRAILGTKSLVETTENQNEEVPGMNRHITWETLDSYYRVMGDETDSFLIELIQTFLPNAQKLIDDLKTSLGNKDLSTFHRSAHTLKSSSASLGAALLSDLARILEMDTIETFPDDSEMRVQILQTELNAIIPEFQEFLDKKKGS